MDIGNIHEAAIKYKLYLEEIKHELLPSLKLIHPNGWYPYGTLHVVQRMDQILKGDYRDVGKLIGNSPVLDLGCADGDLAFLMESLGFDVHAIDGPWINFNGAHGVKLLKAKLDSSVQFFEMNIDREYIYPGQYGLVFMFGVLYHLRNPWRILEELAKVTKYMIMSTKVTRYNKAGHGRIDMKDLPVAYLADYKEINNDPSNTWVFTEMGLERLVRLAGWEYIDYGTFGVERSDPSTAGDQRVFCLMRSKV